MYLNVEWLEGGGCSRGVGGGERRGREGKGGVGKDGGGEKREGK